MLWLYVTSCRKSVRRSKQEIAYGESNGHVTDDHTYGPERAKSWSQYVWSPISRKRLEIEARLQKTTNSKWPMANRIVTWHNNRVILKDHGHGPNTLRAQYLKTALDAFLTTIAKYYIVCCEAWLLVGVLRVTTYKVTCCKSCCLLQKQSIVTHRVVDAKAPASGDTGVWLGQPVASDGREITCTFAKTRLQSYSSDTIRYDSRV